MAYKDGGLNPNCVLFHLPVSCRLFASWGPLPSLRRTLSGIRISHQLLPGSFHGLVWQTWVAKAGVAR